jgi:lysophospholipase L1-like esterase
VVLDLAVLMIGTNNSNGEDNTAEEIADGIKAICAEMRAKLPKTKILILAIFPRGDAEQRKVKGQGAVFNDQWAKNNEASKLASEIADGKKIFYLDINDKFLEDDGTLPKEIMPDLLHPNKKGYIIWAEAMEPTIQKLMGEK